MDYDPYQVAGALAQMARDLSADTSSLTSTDVAAVLLNASRVIEELADASNHYRMRSRVVIIANGEEIELDERIVDALISESIKDKVTEAIEMYVTAARVLPVTGSVSNG